MDLALGLTIRDSSKRRHLFNNKIPAAVIFELQGWEKDDYGFTKDWDRHSMISLERTAERMLAKMEIPQDPGSGRKLKKER